MTSAKSSSMEVAVAVELQDIVKLVKEALKLETDGLYNDASKKWVNAGRLLSKYSTQSINPDEEKIATQLKGMIGWFITRAVQDANIATLSPKHLSLKSFQVYVEEMMKEIESAKEEKKEPTKFTMREPDEIKAPNFWDLQGQDEVRDLIASLFGSANTFNLLMYGPPGTGKTFMAASIAKSYNLLFIEVNSASLMSQFVGGTESNIKELYELARKSVKPDRAVLIFFDEAETILSDRSNSAIATNPVTQFMIEMEKDTNDGVYFFFTTNLLSRIEPAIKRRCYGLFLGYPKTSLAIASLFRVNLNRFPNTVTEKIIKELSEQKKLLSPSAISDIVKLAFTIANKVGMTDTFRQVGNIFVKDANGPLTFADISRREGHPPMKQNLETLPISDDDLIRAWKTKPDSITADELKRYQDEASELLQL